MPTSRRGRRSASSESGRRPTTYSRSPSWESCSRGGVRRMQPYMIVPQQGVEQSDEWVRLGVEAQVQGKLPDAQRYYQQALRIDPQHAVATQNLAIVYAQSNLLAEALLTIERAAIFDGKHAVILMNWALMSLEADRVGEALE